MAKVLIDLSIRELYLFSGEKNMKAYPVAIGKPATPTPVGSFSIVTKIVNPSLGALGTRWMGLSKPSYGIHGTNNPASIGTMASLGCVRMYNRDAEEVFALVSIGTSVEIVTGRAPAANMGKIPQDIQPIGSAIKGKRYAVQSGDTLWGLSLRFGVSLEALIKANKLVNPNVLHLGQQLIIPEESG